MTVKLKKKSIVLCDFDGTISPVDLSELIFRKFAASGLFYSEQWAEGLIGTREEIVQTFATISAGEADVAATLSGIPIDPGFPAFLALVRQADVELAIVSDGLDWPIDVVLADHGIFGVPIYSNHISHDGEKFVFDFPWYDPLTPYAGVCKPLIIDRYHRQGYAVIYIGDGRSDHEAAAVADFVFARDALADYCAERGIEAYRFENFTDLCKLITHLLG